MREEEGEDNQSPSSNAPYKSLMMSVARHTQRR